MKVLGSLEGGRVIPLKTIRRRYILIELVKSSMHIDAKHIVSELKRSLLRLYGEYGLSLADIHPIEYGSSYLVISCDHRMLQQVRSAIAYLDRIGGIDVLLCVSSVSGTLKKLRMRMRFT
ncbi:Rpp14/Pop5 family protein [Candidatus Bathyarchaeota archaeon]|nr:Rpp14/Pop5 family protein [Candidatus Bathyarchaeota archaeon]